MFCAYCRHELPGDAVFCNRCGKQVQLSSAAVSELATWSSSEHTPQVESNTTTVKDNTIFSEKMGPFLPLQETIQTPQTIQVPQTLSTLQRFLVRVFQPALARNAIFGSIAGSIVAASASILTSWLILTIVHFIAAPTTQSAAFLPNNEVAIDNILGIVVSHAPLRDILQLFLVIHGVSIQTLYSTTSDTITAPLHGFLIVPAVFLIIGGYIAASTDLHNQVQSSLVRGGAIALPYTLLLFILSRQVNGNIPTLANGPGAIPATLMVDTTSLLIFGLIWGVLFGLLGASLKVAHGQWRHLLRRYLTTHAHPRIAGMITGACYASALGLGLSFLTLCGFLAYTTFSIPLLAHNLCMTGDWQVLLAWGIAQGPLHAVNLFFFSFGAPITVHISQTGVGQCFYAALPRTALTLRDSNLHLAPWVYALLLIPAISLFMGGRISTALSRTQGSGAHALSGALIAVPFAIIMFFLTFISTITNTITSTLPTGTSSLFSTTATTPSVQSAGTGATDLLLWALLSGALFGALGGLYQGSVAKSWDKGILAFPTFIVEFLAMPVYLLLKLVSKQPISLLRTSTRSLLYSTFACAILLAIATTIVSSLLIANNQTITLQVNQHIRDSVSALLIVIPGVLLFSACAIGVYQDPMREG